MSDRLEEIRQRATRASEGPWSVHYEHPEWDGAQYDPFPYAIHGPKNVTVDENTDEVFKDAYGNSVSEVSEMVDDDVEFMAHSREDIPYLLGEIERLKRENLRLSRREHIVTVPTSLVNQFREWATMPSGSFTADERLTFEAVDGGTFWVRTKPFNIPAA